MKLVILGATMFLAGLLSAAQLLAGAMSCEWVHNGQVSAWWNLTQYGLVPVWFLFTAVAVAGLAIAILGLIRKED